MSWITKRDSCRSCGQMLERDVLQLGDVQIVGFGDKDVRGAPLTLALCSNCSLLQLRHTVDQNLLFRHYYYKSGINQTMRDHLTGIVRDVELRIMLDDGDVVLDIGANDGTLLRAYRRSLVRIGFEPAENLVEDARKGGNVIANEFFNSKDFGKVAKGKKAKAITAISMFYDLENPNEFLGDIVDVLDERGIFVIQQNYLPAMLQKNAFDNIVHEHLEYYSMTSLSFLLERNGLTIVDVEFNDLNGGSFRTYIQKASSVKKGTVQRSVTEAYRQEKLQDLTKPAPYLALARRIERVKRKVSRFIEDEVRKSKKTVYVYGASTRGNTLLQVCGLDYKLIRHAVERNPAKWGTRTAGTNIPVISEEEARGNPPDYLLILPWFFLGEFVIREWQYLSKGGKFILPLPEPSVLQVTQLRDH